MLGQTSHEDSGYEGRAEALASQGCTEEVCLEHSCSSLTFGEKLRVCPLEIFGALTMTGTQCFHFSTRKEQASPPPAAPAHPTSRGRMPALMELLPSWKHPVSSKPVEHFTNHQGQRQAELDGFLWFHSAPRGWCAVRW